MVAWTEDLCVSEMYHGEPGDDRADGWRPDASYDVGDRHAFEVYAPAGPLERIDVTVPGIETDGGIEVGDAAADVTAAYPEAAVHDFFGMFRLYYDETPGGTRGIIVDSQTEKVRILRATAAGMDVVGVSAGVTSIDGCAYLIP